MATKEIHFTKSHEWIRMDDHKIGTVGISEFAQEQMGDLTYVELPKVGSEYSADDEVGTVESVKAASDIYAPVGGSIVEVNERLEDEPELVNSDPYGDGWLFRMRVEVLEDLDELMSEAEYEKNASEEE